MSFAVGDTVMLKSGGPTMTVTYVLSDGEVRCVWFVDGTSVSKHDFPSQALLLSES